MAFNPGGPMRRTPRRLPRRRKGGTVPVGVKPRKPPKRKPPNPGGTTTPAPSTTTTTTSTTGLSPADAGQLAQDAGQLEQEQAAAAAYEEQQSMVTTPSTTAPANAYQDQAQDRANQALQSFFGTGGGDTQQYRPGQSYAYEVAAGTGAENNPT